MDKHAVLAEIARLEAEMKGVIAKIVAALEHAEEKVVGLLLPASTPIASAVTAPVITPATTQIEVKPNDNANPTDSRPASN